MPPEDDQTVNQGDDRLDDNAVSPDPAPVEPAPGSDEIEPDSDGQEAPAGDEPTDEAEISSLSELAEHLGADEAWLSTIKVPTMVNGKPAETTIGEMVASYQTLEAATERLAEAKAVSQATTTELAQKRDAIKQEVATAGGLVVAAEEILMGDIAAANLDQLRKDDPQGYLVAKDQFAERRRNIDQLKRQVGDQISGYMNATPDPETIREEQGKLLEALPELGKPENAQALSDYALASGFTADELAATPDHRIYVLAEKARRWDALQAESADTAAKVVKAPRVVKPGAPNRRKTANPVDPVTALYGGSS